MIPRVASGDAYPLAAANALNEVAAAVNKVNGESGGAMSGRAAWVSPCVARVGYAGSVSLPERSIIQIYDPTLSYEEAPDEFLYSPSILATAPDAAKPGRLAVLLRELVEEGSSEALLMGTTTVTVDVTDSAHRYAEAIDGDATMLRSAATGLFQILTFKTVTDAGTAPATGQQLCTVFFPAAGGGYSGYFAVIKTGAEVVRVVDGSAPSGSSAGPALINGWQRSVAAADIAILATGTTYIWLTATASGDSISAPMITSGNALPDYTAGTCTVLLARVVGGRVVQEHHGMVYGIIWGDCGS